MHLIDSHAHLNFDQFNKDRETVIKRARQTGLVAIVNIGTDLASSRATVKLAERYDFIYAAVGVHPHDAKTVTPAVLDELRTLARHPKVVAIGEIGLDYYRDLSPRDVQLAPAGGDPQPRGPRRRAGGVARVGGNWRPALLLGWA
jgi:TatD DNase family protein